jgi:ectoine hydroxylase-related dioxygenase (phytanoyl-CoA dioxygenase family)
VKLACRLLEIEKPARWFGHMILKPPHYGRETPWHQDEAYWDPAQDHEALSVWMPLEAASVESGCMQFVPGTHRYEVKTHKHIDDDPNVHGLQLAHDGRPEGAVACPLPAGGATFHHCRILHYAGPNSTDNPRRAWITVVNAPSKDREAPAERPWLQKA